MDKPRHPQVIRPWKTQQSQKSKFHQPKNADPRHAHSREIIFRKRADIHNKKGNPTWEIALSLIR